MQNLTSLSQKEHEAKVDPLFSSHTTNFELILSWDIEVNLETSYKDEPDDHHETQFMQ